MGAGPAGMMGAGSQGMGQGMGAGPGPHHPPPHGPNGMPWGQHGPGGMMPGMMHMMGGMMHPPRAAVFMFKRGDERIVIKCADNESTKACVDGASTLIGKLAPAPGAPGGATTQ